MEETPEEFTVSIRVFHISSEEKQVCTVMIRADILKKWVMRSVCVWMGWGKWYEVEVRDQMLHKYTQAEHELSG